MSVVVGQYLINAIPRVLWGTEPIYQWSVDLYTNLHVPSPVDSLAAFQLCTLPGYSTFLLDGVEWSGTSENPLIASYQYPLITWNFDPYSGAQVTIFGYVVCSPPSNSGGNPAPAMFYAELFPAPYPVPPAGGSLPLILLFTAEQCLNP